MQNAELALVWWDQLLMSASLCGFDSYVLQKDNYKSNKRL